MKLEQIIQKYREEQAYYFERYAEREETFIARLHDLEAVGFQVSEVFHTHTIRMLNVAQFPRLEIFDRLNNIFGDELVSIRFSKNSVYVGWQWKA